MNDNQTLTVGTFKQLFKKLLKEELSEYPTKSDLKKELSAYASKQDLKHGLTKLHQEIKKRPTKKYLDRALEDALGSFAYKYIMPLHTRVSNIETDMKEVKTDLKSNRLDLKTIKIDVAALKLDMDQVKRTQAEQKVEISMIKPKPWIES